MAKPLVVIVGRPNVGKSTLFNRMVGSQAAIVEDIPGVTRDRNYLDAEWEGKSFIVVDTGGFYPEPSEDIFLEVKEQALFAIDEADLIIHLMDGKEGLNPNDIELSKLLRASGKEVLWVVNKVDAPSREDRLYDFYRLGVDRLFALSAETGYEFGEFMDVLVTLLPERQPGEEAIDYPKVAVVGRPNVGKSTLVNTLTGKKRMIVSPVAGTTRDSVDSVCTYYGKKYLFIDTAGLRRKGKIGYSLERYSMVRAIRSIERCDVALVVLDASSGIVEQDKRIAGIIEKYGKGAVFLLNKWDLLEDPETVFKHYQNEFKSKLWFFTHAPMLTISGLERKRVTKVFPLIDEVMEERKKRIPTAELNVFLKKTLDHLPPLPLYKGKAIKLNYITQVGTGPPAFVVFANKPEGLKDAFIRYLERSLRERFSFRGTPIRVYVKQKNPA
ncbi:MAG TPA: ribosome biogenesis GTPase Der [Thermodesulfovibrionales bacterium]|jgi:GTP-binding protein|nr:ribosome biogenesis GTPase Der [Thermodesulfovibrionales bacterium]